MKKIILSLAAVSALAAAMPAAAQSWDPRYDDRYERGYDNRDRYEDRWDGDNRMDVTDRLERRLERAMQNGRLTRQEYYTLRASVRQLEQLEYRYQRDGVVTRWERDDLMRRANYVENRLRRERNDRDFGVYN
ncbi:MAG TPA: hypothetical protein VIO94_04320 [Phenylobacterium sp.]